MAMRLEGEEGGWRMERWKGGVGVLDDWFVCLFVGLVEGFVHAFVNGSNRIPIFFSLVEFAWSLRL